jgi:hypothetical protein
MTLHQLALWLLKHKGKTECTFSVMDKPNSRTKLLRIEIEATSRAGLPVRGLRLISPFEIDLNDDTVGNELKLLLLQAEELI